MEKKPEDSDDLEYDKDRLADDPEYRDEILTEIAENTSAVSKATVTRWMLYVVFGMGLFTSGVYVGGRLGNRLAYYTALMLTCFVVVPTLGYLLYYRYES